MYLSRRHFINLFTAGCLLPFFDGCRKSTSAIYNDSEDIFNYPFTNKIIISNNDVIVFQGDSITDSHRNRLVITANNDAGLGNGYADMITDNFLKNHPAENVFFFNRGVSGDTVTSLSKRWTADCINLNPSIINILIGVNDLRGNVSPNSYYTNYKTLLQETKNRLPESKFIICEPFLLPNYPDYNRLSSPFHEYRKIVRLLAKDFNAVFIPYYELLLKDEAGQSSYNVISTDGFHPTTFGHSLMANFWLNNLL